MFRFLTFRLFVSILGGRVRGELLHPVAYATGSYIKHISVAGN